jgi:multiple sugar transport system substrate-binding protein
VRSLGLKPPISWSDIEAAARVLKAESVKYPIALRLGPQEAEGETLTMPASPHR